MEKFLRAAFLVVFVFTGYFGLAQHVVISEVYGGGGNAGAQFKSDFVELYNPTNADVVVTNWSLQYTSAAGTGWSANIAVITDVNPVIIKSKGFLLVKLATGTTGADLPAPYMSPSVAIAMSATAGKIALCNNSTALAAVANPVGAANIVDFVGYGTANGFEGAVGAGLSNTTSLERKASSTSTVASMNSGGADEFLGNGYDLDNNSTDFIVRTFPQPQNSSTVEPDVTAPLFTLGYPAASNIAETQFDLVGNLNEIGKLYYVVLADGAGTPPASQVKAGKDAGGNTVALSGQLSIPSASANFTKTISGLLPSTSYDVYVVAEDVQLNLQSAAVIVDVTTLVASAPLLGISTPSITFPGFTVLGKQSVAQSYTITASNLTNDVSVSVSGNFTISTDNINYSSSASINQLLFAGNAPQTIYVKFTPTGSVGDQAGTITHSSTGATNKLLALSGKAIDPLNQDFNDKFFLTNSGWSQFSKVGAEFWASTDFGHTCLTGCNSATLDKAAQMNGFSGSAKDNEDWLISPAIDLTGFVNFPALSFWTISAFAGPGLQLKYSSDYTGSGDPALATWTAIDGKFPAVNSSLWTKSVNIILPKANVYVAFVYTSNTTSASRWTLDDWKIEDIANYIDVPGIAFSFGEIVAGDHSASQSFSFTTIGYGDITVTAPQGYEISADNSSFAASQIVAQADAALGKTIFVRFAPPIKKVKWEGTINFKGTSLDVNYGVLSGSSLPKAETFDVACYNLEFFGTDVKDASNVEFGPIDDALQVTNVTTVLNTIGADIFGVEEIADDNAFNQLVANLPGYDKIVSPRWSYSFDPPDPNFPPQKVAFIYNTSTVQIVSSRVMFSKLYDDIRAGTKTLPGYPTTDNSFWSSGRLPFMVTADVTINGLTKRIRIIDVHTKSGSAPADYNRRLYDVQVLHDSLTTNYPNDNIILVGDYNDLVEGSIYTGHTSTFKPFVDNTANYNVLTYNLSLSGASTFPSSSSFIDHVIISNDLASSYVTNSISVEDPRNYISNYSNTTSDHLPVVARFLLTKNDQTITFAQPAAKTYNDADFDLTATATSNLNVSFASADPSIASVVGKTVTIHKAGTVNITASQIGNVSFNPAADVIQPLVINKADQTITFAGPLPDKIFGDVPFGLTAGSTSGLTVTFTSSTPAVATINNATVTIVGGGNTTITAQQAGDANYNAAPGVPLVLSVSKANQTITFGAIADKTVGDPAFSLGATASSNLAVTYGTTSDKITLNANQVTIVKAGRATITGSQAGNTNYNAATPADQSFCIKPAKPTVTLSNANTATPILTSSASAGNQWYLNGAIIAGATNPTLSVTGIGIYKVQIKVDDCISAFSNDTPIIFTGDLSQVNGNIIVYPNPVTDYLEVRGIEREVTSARVIDMMGRSSVLILEKNGETHRGLVDYLSTGMYILRVEDGMAAYQTKFIKK